MKKHSFEQDKQRGKLFIFIAAIVFASFYGYTNKEKISEFVNNEIPAFSQFEEAVKVNELKDSVEDGLADIMLESGDWDEDGLDNILEVLLGSDQFVLDTDDDGFDDYEEFVFGYDPDSVENVVLTEEGLEAKYEEFLLYYANPDGGVVQLYHLERAKGYIAYEDADAGLAEFNKAIVLNPSFEAYEDFIYVLYDAGLFEESKAVSTGLIVDFPEKSKSFFHLAYSTQQSQDAEGAQAIYQIAIDMGSSNPYIYNNLGVMAQNDNDNDGAVEFYKKAIELSPETEMFKKNLSVLYRNMGEIQKAQEIEALLAI